MGKPEDTAQTEEPKVVSTHQMFVVPPSLMRETLELLQEELPMAKCRDVVLKLEQCRIANINKPAQDDGTART